MNDVDLHVEFIGERRTIEPGDELTFGRQADLHIDDNRHLHRVLGRFWSRGEAWWLTNEGRSITIQIADADSRSSVQLAPGSEIALSFPNSILRFRAGITDYELIGPGPRLRRRRRGRRRPRSTPTTRRAARRSPSAT